jgi:hypothetical protein
MIRTFVVRTSRPAYETLYERHDRRRYEFLRMKAIPSINMLEAAAYALVSERCRQSYLHDIRGGLQALHSAVELLVRAANSPGDNPALAEKATALARRAVQKQEKSLVELVNQITPQTEIAGTVNVGDLVSDVLRFIRNDAANKSIAFRLEAAGDVQVLAQPHKFRLLILGLCSTLTDGLAPGSVVDVAVARADSEALVEFRSTMSCAAVNPEYLWNPAGAMSSPCELLLALTQHWAAANGGRLELSTEPHLPNTLRIYYPLASAEPEKRDHGAGTIDVAAESPLHRG